jgi:hypothetical protein
MLIFSLFWSAVVLFMDGQIANDLFRQFNSSHYPSAVGTVTQSEAKVHKSSHGQTNYDTSINYRFDVGGRAFTGARLRFNPGTVPDKASANRLVAAHPAGSTVLVYYNPNDPMESVLMPGINGSDLMLFLFLTPFNAIMLGFWRWLGGWLRERLFRPPAGGVKIITDGRSTRVRLPEFGAVACGLVTVGALGFVSMLILAICTGMQPSTGLVLTVIALVYGAGAGVWLWRWRKISAGIDDLVINQAGRTLELPRTQGRHQRLSVGIAEIESLTVSTIEHIGSKGRHSYTYAPTLHFRGSQPDQQLEDWSDKVKAGDFTEWLRHQLRL